MSSGCALLLRRPTDLRQTTIDEQGQVVGRETPVPVDAFPAVARCFLGAAPCCPADASASDLPACCTKQHLRIPKDKERGGKGKRLRAAGELLQMLQDSVREARAWVIPEGRSAQEEVTSNPQTLYSLTWNAVDAKRDVPFVATFALRPRRSAQSSGSSSAQSSLTVVHKGHDAPVVESFDGRVVRADRQALRALLTTLYGRGAPATLTVRSQGWQRSVQLFMSLRASSVGAGSAARETTQSAREDPGFEILRTHSAPRPASSTGPLLSPEPEVLVKDADARQSLKSIFDKPEVGGLLFQEPAAVEADITATLAARKQSSSAALHYLTSECRKRARGQRHNHGESPSERRKWAQHADWCRKLSFYALLKKPGALCRCPGGAAKEAFEALCQDFRLAGDNRQHALAYVHHLCVRASLEGIVGATQSVLPWETSLCDFAEGEIDSHYDKTMHKRIQAEAPENKLVDEAGGGKHDRDAGDELVS